MVRWHLIRRWAAVRGVAILPRLFGLVGYGSPILVPFALLRLSAKVIPLRSDERCIVAVGREACIDAKRPALTVRDEHHRRTLNTVWAFPPMRPNRFCVRPIRSSVRRRGDHRWTRRGLWLARAAGKRDCDDGGEHCRSQRSLAHELVTAAPIRSHCDAMRSVACSKSQHGVWTKSASAVGHSSCCRWSRSAEFWRNARNCHHSANRKPHFAMVAVPTKGI